MSSTDGDDPQLHAYSALRLRRILAAGGVVLCTALAVIALMLDTGAFGIVVAVLLAIGAAAGVVDLVVVGRQLRARARRGEPNEGIFGR
jgi:hypothetical protein